ncbi:hypothetical protein QE152_g6724 [Popillia japonica]|uniref:Uncharacterized protein n=1 Tax=Popillia japonica TaxID=7064 RepID=A0AAW1MHM0_POPJA
MMSPTSGLHKVIGFRIRAREYEELEVSVARVSLLRRRTGLHKVIGFRIRAREYEELEVSVARKENLLSPEETLNLVYDIFLQEREERAYRRSAYWCLEMTCSYQLVLYMQVILLYTPEEATAPTN